MRISKVRALGFGLAAFAAAALLDVTTGFQVSFFLLHLIPILYVTWYAGYRWGIVFVAMTAALSVYLGFFQMPERPKSALFIADMASDFLAMLLIVFMQTKLRHSFERIQQLSRHDALSGSLNRAGFVEALEEEIDRSRRFAHPFSLVFLDCDNFKAVNDSCGHAAGDAVLACVASTLKASLRSVDAVGRIGGDEFAVLLPETDVQDAKIPLMHAKQALDAAMRAGGWQVGFSIGVATFCQPPDCPERALAQADALMYEVKSAAKNDILFRVF